MGSSKSKQTSSAEPWAPAQPYLKDVYSEASNLYHGGAPEFWQGTANAPLTDQMQQVLGSIWNRGMTGDPNLDAAQGSTGAVAAGNLVGSNPAYNFLMGQVYNPQGNPALGYAQDIASNVQTNPALQYLEQEASGANVGKNPYLEATYNRAADPLVKSFQQTTLPGINSQYALAGRYGSRAQATALGQAQSNVNDQLTNLATGIYGGAYQNDRANQLAAMQGLTGAYSSDIQNRLNAGNFLSGVYDQGLQRQLYGSQLLGQLGQQDVGNMLQAASMVPGLGQADYSDLQQALSVGQYGQQRAQAEQDLARQGWDFSQQEPYNWLAQYAQLIYGNPGSMQGFGTTTSTAKQGSSIGQMLGAGLSLASMFV